MADQHPCEGASSSTGESSDAVLEINVKTLDSQIYSFQVDKNMLVSLFKEKIANDIGVPVGQQRLIYRGKVLKDEHMLSDYQLENGHTLHLVVRQPVQSQPPSDSSSGGTTGNNGNRGNDVNSGAPRNRLGQISHSVVLGTFNLGDQGEGVIQDLPRVIGAVMNSFGLGGQTPSANTGPQVTLSTSAQPPQGNEADGTRGSVGGQNQDQTQAQTGQPVPGQPFQLPSSLFQIPLSAAASVPVASVHAPIPEALVTLNEFMYRMEQALSQSGYRPNISSTSNEDIAQVEIPTIRQGLPALEALSIILRRAQRLLSGHAVAELSHIAGRLEQERSSSDPGIRGQIQTESMQAGLVMQHLGSLLLELGRVMMIMRTGPSPDLSTVNAGPAVYVSPLGPNPIMVQPFPLQTASLFGGSVPLSNPVAVGPVGVGSAPRHVNIHIHAVGNRASNEGGAQGERGNNSSPGDMAGTASVRVLPTRNVFSAAVPSTSTGIAISRPGVPVSQTQSFSPLTSSIVNEINSRLRNLAGNRHEGDRVAPGEIAAPGFASASATGNDVGNRQENRAVVDGAVEQSVSLPLVMPESDVQQSQPESDKLRSNENLGNFLSSKDLPTSEAGGCSSSSGEPSMQSENVLGSREKQDFPEGAKAVPLGLGLGGLDRKKRTRQTKTMVDSVESGSSGVPIDLNVNPTSAGEQLLESVAACSSGGQLNRINAPFDLNVNPTSAGQQLLASLASRSSGGQLNRINAPFNLNVNPTSAGQQVSESVSSHSSGGQLNRMDASSPNIQLSMGERTVETRQPGAGSTDGQLDTANAMSQVLQNPDFNGLLSGLSEQIGGGSPDVFSNMLQQFTQSPQIMNTVSQIAQQVDGQDLGNMLSGMGGGQGGGFDLSRMVQQMMPVVTRALSRGSATSHPLSAVETDSQQPHAERTSTGADNPDEQNLQTRVQQVAQRIESLDPPEDVFRAVVENASEVHENAVGHENVDELCRDWELARDYLVMLQHQLCQRLGGFEGEGDGLRES